MKILDTLDLLVGRMLLPTLAAAPGSPSASQLWLIGNQLFFRNAAGDATRTILTDADRGVANGVASLGADGLVPTTQLPGSLTATFSVPIGGGIDWYGDPSTIPSNTLVCDGAEYLVASYPLLAAALRQRYGRSTSDLYFRVPDVIGRFRYGAWSYPNSGMVRKVVVTARGQGYTAGSYTFTFGGGTSTTAATGRVVIANENVPGVGVTGVIQRVEITGPGSYTSLGAAASGTAGNCGLTIPGASTPGGTGFAFDVYAQPVAAVRAPYAFSVQIDNHGTGYTVAPEVVISGGSLTGCTAYAIVRNSGIAEVVITNPGNGNIAGATVSFVGGDGTGATASLRTELRYGLSGDYLGEEQHLPLLGELMAHTHALTQWSDTGSQPFGDGAGSDSSAATASTGGSYPMPIRPAAVGVIPLIRAA